MKKYLRELILLIINIFFIYLYPLILFIKKDDAIGVVLMLIFVTLIISTLLGCISKYKIKYLYPVVIAVLFIPTVFIYYNESALVHSIWHLITSYIGLLIGITIRKNILNKRA